MTQVSLEGLSHRYGTREVLREVNLSLAAGESVGITGPSGCGKTTLARILTLHLKPERGAIRLRGLSCWDQPYQRRRDLRRRLQLVFQDPGSSFPYPWKLWQIAAEASAIAGCSVNEQRDEGLRLMNRVGLPQDYAGRGALELSGGERRRVAVARALGARPELLVLDESLSGLDAPLQAELIAMLDRLRQEENLTLVTISHDPRVLRRLAGRVLVMERGQIVEDTQSAGFFLAPSSDVGRRLLDASYWRAGE